ncbi:hypothetical protein Tco_0514524 [Tanacetum coccineum]
MMPTLCGKEILPFAAWVPIGKSNFVLDLQKKQKNPIFQISVDILQNTNFFRAFPASSSGPAICIQQFWNTLTYEAKTGVYSFQLDENRFVLDANLLREALEITHIDQARQFVSPPSGDAIMDFVNELGYTEELHFVSRMATFLADKANLSIAPQKGKKTKPHVIPYCRHGNLKFVPKGEEDEVFRMQIPKDLITNTIRNAPYYNAYMEMVAKHDKKIIAEKGGKKKSASKADQSKKPTTSKQPKPVPSKQSEPAPAMKYKVTQEKPSKPSPVKHPKRGKVQKFHKGKSSLKLIDEDEEAYGQAHVGGVAICEQVEEATRQLPVVEGKGKAIATDEQAAQSLLALRMPKRRNAETGADTDITTSTVNIEVLYAEDVQGEEISHTVVLEEKIGELDEGQAGSDPGKTPESRPPPEHKYMDEDQAGPNPRQSHEALAGLHPELMHDDFIATIYPKVHEILKHTTEEHVYMENPLSSSGTLSSMKNLDDAFTFDDQFLNDKPTEEEPGKTTIETKAESMVIVPIHQASTSVTPLSTTIIDLSPPKPKHKLQEQTTQALSSRIFTLELRDLPYKINQTANEVVKEVVHIALQAPLRDRFRELPEADMKEILHQRMFESGSYKSLPKHVALYEALEASMKRANRD